MFRKTIIAIAATSALAIAALPSTASAHKWHGWRGVGIGLGLGLAVAGAGIVASCYRTQWIETRYGWRQVVVNVCDYPY